MIYRFTAEEDIRYKMMSSYPPEGFFVPQGGTFLILEDVIKHLRVKKASNGRAKGKYHLDVVGEGIPAHIRSHAEGSI